MERIVLSWQVAMTPLQILGSFEAVKLFGYSCIVGPALFTETQQFPDRILLRLNTDKGKKGDPL